MRATTAGPQVIRTLHVMHPPQKTCMPSKVPTICTTPDNPPPQSTCPPTSALGLALMSLNTFPVPMASAMGESKTLVPLPPAAHLDKKHPRAPHRAPHPSATSPRAQPPYRLTTWPSICTPCWQRFRLRTPLTIAAANSRLRASLRCELPSHPPSRLAAAAGR